MLFSLLTRLMLRMANACRSGTMFRGRGSCWSLDEVASSCAILYSAILETDWWMWGSVDCHVSCSTATLGSSPTHAYPFRVMPFSGMVMQSFLLQSIRISRSLSMLYHSIFDWVLFLLSGAYSALLLLEVNHSTETRHHLSASAQRLVH
jgi:hypothetical protein